CYRPCGAGTAFPPLRGYKFALKPGVSFQCDEETSIHNLVCPSFYLLGCARGKFFEPGKCMGGNIRCVAILCIHIFCCFAFQRAGPLCIYERIRP
ncbi:hypothetical protein OQJ59_16560, partial [Microbulbifer thermotolerans]|uniref:hypothetical protein n=1 Tax=Microbulbifer thermotolerans TaxID=252514 RepID=UPI00224B791E